MEQHARSNMCDQPHRLRVRVQNISPRSPGDGKKDNDKSKVLVADGGSDSSLWESYETEEEDARARRRREAMHICAR